MTPNDLDAYLQVLVRNKVGSAAVKLADGTEFHVMMVPDLPLEKLGEAPPPGGWKRRSLPHLDNPEELREDNEYKGTLPS